MQPVVPKIDTVQSYHCNSIQSDHLGGTLEHHVREQSRIQPVYYSCQLCYDVVQFALNDCINAKLNGT